MKSEFFESVTSDNNMRMRKVGLPLLAGLQCPLYMGMANGWMVVKPGLKNCSGQSKIFVVPSQKFPPYRAKLTNYHIWGRN